MNKRLFFLWFGDEEPSYAQWSINNYKITHSDWDIHYIHYNIEQIKNYEDLNDDFLVQSVEQCKKTFGNQCTYARLSNIYRWKILTQKYDTYLDLDTFPIGKLDDFVIQHKNQSVGYFRQQCIGYCTNRQIDDQWFISNTKKSCINVNVIYKNIDLNKDCVYVHDMCINKEHIELFNERRKMFFDCKLKIGDNFACTKFTPVEHYHSVHRKCDSIEPKKQIIKL